MRAKDVRSIGVPDGPPVRAALACVASAARAGMPREDIERGLRLAVMLPADHAGDPHFGRLARAMQTFGPRKTAAAPFIGRTVPARWRQWGADLDVASISQMENACRLPVTVGGALMPDAHVGYGLPIGGVLATDNAVIPYAVGVDIACRMRITALDIPASALDDTRERARFRDAIASETRFGVGASFKTPRDHAVMDDDWSVSPVTSRNKAKARQQLGTSGSGNHFVEFGVLSVGQRSDLGLEPGEYLALMSHSGSRGTGAAVADHYSRLAMRLRPDLPKDLMHLAWLDLDAAEGREYWAAMELMGRYAAANHEVIHREMLRALGARALSHVENHHNFAWRETHGGRDVVVHRKGATPAGEGVLGVIPGSMASPAYIVRGKGEPDSLRSASHGAGRVMSRTKAKSTFCWADVKRQLTERNVELISAGLDEVPGVYKNIDEVMAQQRDLVDVLATFRPRLVKMAPPGERPED